MVANADGSAVCGANVDACRHPVCKLQPTSVDTEQLRSVLNAVAVRQPFVALVRVYPPAAAFAHVGLFAPPPLRSPLLIRLQTKLRV